MDKDKGNKDTEKKDRDLEEDMDYVLGKIKSLETKIDVLESKLSEEINQKVDKFNDDDLVIKGEHLMLDLNTGQISSL